MGVCRGNLGNLMQHWVLTETLAEIARHTGDQHLLFVTSHSMAPWSVPRRLAKAGEDYSRPRFDAARGRLGRTEASAFERAWASVTGPAGVPYPSSAVFAARLWAGPLSLALCEYEGHVAAEIGGWLALPEVVARLAPTPVSQVHIGDWRARFTTGFHDPCGAAVVFAEMDPMRFERNGPERCRRDDRAVLYVEDLDAVCDAFAGTTVPVVLQISSFSANNDNPHRAVEPAISSRLGLAGFQLRGRVEADGNMISLVYSRGLDLWSDAAALGRQFLTWAAGL